MRLLNEIIHENESMTGKWRLKDIQDERTSEAKRGWLVLKVITYDAANIWESNAFLANGVTWISKCFEWCELITRARNGGVGFMEIFEWKFMDVNVNMESGYEYDQMNTGGLEENWLCELWNGIRD